MCDFLFILIISDRAGSRKLKINEMWTILIILFISTNVIGLAFIFGAGKCNKFYDETTEKIFNQRKGQSNGKRTDK